LDLEAAKRRFAHVHAEISKMEQQAEQAVVKDEQTLKGTVSFAGQVKALKNKIEKQRKEIIEEPNKFVKAVNSFCKDFTGKLSGIEQTLKQKIGEYQYRLEMARREAERKAREEAQRLQEELNKEAEEKGIEPVKVGTPVIPKKEGVVRTETGTSSHIRKKWKVEVIDEDKVERKYCSPDKRKLQQAVDAGVRKIEGCRIFEEVITVIK
jgi:DNA repair exonuclease SbcCD ATPase subunit